MTDEERLAFLEEGTARNAWQAPELWSEEDQCFIVSTEHKNHDVAVMPLMYTGGLIILPKVRTTQTWYLDRWCYHSVAAAIEAAKAWDGVWPEGEPDGWHRHPATGRRRENGDPSTEEVRM